MGEHMSPPVDTQSDQPSRDASQLKYQPKSLRERLKERYPQVNSEADDDQYPRMNAIPSYDFDSPEQGVSLEGEKGNEREKPKQLVPPNTSLEVLERLVEQALADKLTEDELSLVQFCKIGMSNRQIAEVLGITEKAAVNRIHYLRKNIEKEILSSLPLGKISSFGYLAATPNDSQVGILPHAASRGSLKTLTILRLKYTTEHETKRYLIARRGWLSDSVKSLGLIPSHQALSTAEHDMVRRNSEFQEYTIRINGVECFYESDLPKIREMIDLPGLVPLTELEPDISRHSGIRKAISRGRLQSQVIRKEHHIHPEDYRQYNESITGKRRGKKPKDKSSD